MTVQIKKTYIFFINGHLDVLLMCVVAKPLKNVLSLIIIHGKLLLKRLKHILDR
jgi:hypothetical protein